MDFGECATRAVDDAQKQQNEHEPENVADYWNDRQVQPQKQSQCAKHQRAVAFPHRSIVAARCTYLSADNSHSRKGVGDWAQKILKPGFQAVDARQGANFMVLATDD